MIYLRLLLCLLTLGTIPLVALTQPRRDAHVIFKDGFHIKGMVNESVREVIWDRASGRPFPIFSGNFFLDDKVRDILFSPSQVHEVKQPPEYKPPMKFVRRDRYYQPRDLLAKWEFSFGKWTDAGERSIQVSVPGGKSLEIKQRIEMVTSNYMVGVSQDYKWNMLYFTEEFGAEKTRKIVLQIMSEIKPYKDWEQPAKLLELAKFMQEAGWLKEAEKELQIIVSEYPEAKKLAEERLAAVRKDRANLFVDSLKKASDIGQHQVAMNGLNVYDRDDLGSIVSPDPKLAAVDLRAKYDKLKTDVADMNRFLKELPAQTKNRALWSKATAFIADELNFDTCSRLDEFLVSAKQLELERKNNAAVSLSAEKVLAIAISGWLQGTHAALPDTDAALKLANARENVLEYLKSGDANRAGPLSTVKQTGLPVDVLARMIRMIPPANAHPAEKLNDAIQTLTIEVPNADGGTYQLQLPPDYHHLRAHPVLILLQGGRDKADEMHKRFSEEAAKLGFILVTPLWAQKGLQPRYQNTVAEQTLVMDTLRDVRHRFQVDSDRVFLFGWEDGANMAFDVALGHPDQFAGVVPMNGGLLPFTRRFYWPNAQYLPFYVIGGERDGHSAQMRDLFKKEWTRDPYACMYVEYKGRASEWYGVEIEKSMDWMKRKKRYQPMKEMGRPNIGTSIGEEFHSTRITNNRFYWLRADNFSASVLDDHRTKNFSGKHRPAMLQANLSVGNKTEKGEAKIWNQLTVRAQGMKNLTFLITPEMKMDLKHPLAITLNSQSFGGMRKIEPSVDVLLEELAQTGDRQRLVIARVEIRP